MTAKLLELCLLLGAFLGFMALGVPVFFAMLLGVMPSNASCCQAAERSASVRSARCSFSINWSMMRRAVLWSPATM